MRRIVGWALFLLAPLIFVQQAVAANTPEIGGNSGVVYDQSCGGESLVIGFEYNSGKALDSVGIICGMRANGDWTGEIQHRGRVGGGGGSGPFTILCPPLNAVAGVQVFVDNNGSIHHIGVGCFPVIGPELTYLSTTNEGGEASYNVHSDCPPFEFATGMYGHHAALVNSMGLHCAAPVMKAAAPPPPPPPATPPTPTVPPDDGDNGDDAAAGNCTITDDVDVYPAPGGQGQNLPFIRGGEVVASNQQQDGWYRITGANVPMGQGWVWGDFIDCK